MQSLLIGNKLNWFHFFDSKLSLGKRELVREKILHLFFLEREQKLRRRIFFFLSINLGECSLPK